MNNPPGPIAILVKAILALTSYAALHVCAHKHYQIRRGRHMLKLPA